MIVVGQFSDALRALGRFLQMVRASEIIVIDQPDVVEVSWRGKRGAREEKQYRQWELDALRTWARMVRGLEEGSLQFGTQEAMRMLGREVDTLKIQGLTAVETSEGWWISGKIENTDFRENYSHASLMLKSQQFHAQRLAEEAKRSGARP